MVHLGNRMIEFGETRVGWMNVRVHQSRQELFSRRSRRFESALRPLQHHRTGFHCSQPARRHFAVMGAVILAGVAADQILMRRAVRA